jgi:hypothetical protein
MDRRYFFVPLVTVLILPAFVAGVSDDHLPRFTEEREAAALFFIKKHSPEVLPLLEQLKKDNLIQYQHEIREVFYVTELLADLQDEPKRYELELRIWKTESKAHALVAQLSTPSEEERKKIEAALMDLARELVDLDIQVLEWKSEQLDKELGELKDELARNREQIEKVIRTRFDGLLTKIRKPRK